MIQIDNTLLLYAKKYQEAFGEKLPLRMFPQTLTNKELFAAIDHCIERGTDDLIEKYCPELDDDILF